MIDVAPALLEAIQKDYSTGIKNNKALVAIQKKIANGTANHALTNEFSIKAGEILARSYQNNLSSAVLPDGKMYYNIAEKILKPTLGENHKLVAEVAANVQTSMNEAAGIGIKGIEVKINQDRMDGIINKIANAEQFDDVAWMLDEPVVNLSQSIVDDTIKSNVEFQGKSGLSPTITRVCVGGCCDWCREIAGVYSYPNVPQDVYRRHRYCRCTVEYDPGDGSKRQNVWTNKRFTPEEEAAAEARKNFVNPAEPKKLSMGSHVNEYFYGDDDYQKWKNSLTDKERTAANEYTSHIYKQINSYNRGNFDWAPDGAFGSVIDDAEKFMANPPDIPPQQPGESFFEYKRRKNSIIPQEYQNALASKQRVIENNELLDGIIDRYELKDDIRTFRAIEPDALPRFDKIDDLIGQSYTDKSFMSTSPTLDSKAVNKNYIMEITVPKGTGNGAYLEEFTAVSGEYEFLLPRNKEFKITGVRVEADKNFIKMEMLP